MEGELQKEQDARVEKLWRTLDTGKEGQLDREGLKKGLRRINHPLHNADSLLDDVLKVVDTNADGYIQFSEFRAFVKQTEKELWQLFKSIDRDHNGQLDKVELQTAFKQAGLIIPKSKLDRFFSEVDTNHDGVISFDEWRNFLLFIPAQTPGLNAVLSYYSSTLSVNPEGDVHISNETVEGLGKSSLPRILFGVLIAIATSPRSKQFSSPSSLPPQRPEAQKVQGESQPNSFPWDPGEVSSKPTMSAHLEAVPAGTDIVKRIRLLTDILPDPGYFVAGGVAGVVSRTATAPLDRLKVYLIAQTGVKDETVHAIKSGAPVQATKVAARPLIDATKTLWRMGGFRSLFAGNGLNVVKIMPESAMRFGIYEGSKRALAKFQGHNDVKALGGPSQFIAAGFGGIMSQFSIYPLDTLKFRMQCETIKGGQHGNALILTTARRMWSTNGIRAFYRGLPMGLVGVFPYSAIDLTTFGYLKRSITARNVRVRNCSEEDAAPGNIITAVTGAFAGSFGATLVYPLNLLRTRLQSQGTAIHPPTYEGIWDVTVKTVRGEGYKGLYKGLTPNLLKVVPAVSISYVVYDNSKRLLGLG